jgi:hypothetical protein
MEIEAKKIAAARRLLLEQCEGWPGTLILQSPTPAQVAALGQLVAEGKIEGEITGDELRARLAGTAWRDDELSQVE